MRHINRAGDFLMLGVLLGFGVVPTQAQTSIDPCVFATADRLKALLQSHIGPIFPISDRGVTLSDPNVVAATCPQFRAEIRTGIRYRKTSFPKYSTSGQTRFGSPIVANITYNGAFPPSPNNIIKAAACLTNIQVLGLNLKRIPNWIDNTWIRSTLQKNFRDSMCFDVAQPVASHLKAGGTLASTPRREEPVRRRIPLALLTPTLQSAERLQTGGGQLKARRPTRRASGARTTQRDQEYRALVNRARQIGDSVASGDSRAIAQAEADQKRLRADVHSWAKRHNVRFETQVITFRNPIAGLGKTASTSGTLNIEQAKRTLMYIRRGKKRPTCDQTVVIQTQRDTHALCRLAAGGEEWDGEVLVCTYDCPIPEKEGKER